MNKANPASITSCVFSLLALLFGGCHAQDDALIGEEWGILSDIPARWCGGAGAVVTKSGITATFSIIAVDPETGQCGAAVASKYPAVGKVVPYVRGGVGAFCTQHRHNPAWGEQALDLLEAGKAPEQVLAQLLRDDPQREQRQLAIIDMEGRVANHNPSRAEKGSEYWAAMSGRYYSCQGNTLVGREVIVAMSKAFEETQGTLTDRLMAALITGDCAGGDHRGRLAAGIRVAKRGVDGYWFELYVDNSDDAVIDLARKYAQSKHDAKGQWKGGKLPFKNPRPKNPSSTSRLRSRPGAFRTVPPHNFVFGLFEGVRTYS